jgi:hypothetical protein
MTDRWGDEGCCSCGSGCGCRLRPHGFRRRGRNPARDGDEGRRYGNDEHEEEEEEFLPLSSAARPREPSERGTPPAAVVSGGREGREGGDRAPVSSASIRMMTVSRTPSRPPSRCLLAGWLAGKRERERVGEQRPAATRRLWRACLGEKRGVGRLGTSGKAAPIWLVRSDLLHCMHRPL